MRDTCRYSIPISAGRQGHDQYFNQFGVGFVLENRGCSSVGSLSASLNNVYSTVTS